MRVDEGKRLKIIGGEVITPYRCIQGHEVVLEGGKIVAVQPYAGRGDGTCQVLDVEGQYVAPGFVDIHVHGGGGHDFMDSTQAAFVGAARLHREHGTTSLLATTLSCPHEELMDNLSACKQAHALPGIGACIAGAHLEGPYFSLAQCGAQDPRYIVPPQQEQVEEILSTFGNTIKRWTFAPEVTGTLELAQRLRTLGILPCIGHSDASEEQVVCALESGCTHLTHLYSGMSTLTRKAGYRVLGIVESAYLYPQFTTEVIADGCHLPEGLLTTAFRQMGSARLALVTDAMRAAGQAQGESLLGSYAHGQACIVEDGVAKLPDRTAFAGSVATGDRLVGTMRRMGGATLCEAVTMLTATPARIAGLTGKGILAAGMDADLVVFDEQINIRHVVQGGVIVKTEGKACQ